MDITGLTAGNAYTFFVGATNQFSTQISTGTPIGSYDPTNSAVTALVNISTATTSVTLPAAGVVPNVPTSVAVGAFSNAYIYVSFTWNEPVIFGSTGVTTYTIMRGTGSTTPTAFTFSAGSVVTTPATATTALSCWDLLSALVDCLFVCLLTFLCNAGLSPLAPHTLTLCKPPARLALPLLSASLRPLMLSVLQPHSLISLSLHIIIFLFFSIRGCSWRSWVAFWDVTTMLIWNNPVDQGGVAATTPATNLPTDRRRTCAPSRPHPVTHAPDTKRSGTLRSLAPVT